MKVYCELLFGGKTEYEKKDKTTGNKTGVKSYMYNFLEVDNNRQVVNFKTYFSDENLDIKGLALLKPCKVCFEISAMSDFKKFVSVEPIK